MKSKLPLILIGVVIVGTLAVVLATRTEPRRTFGSLLGADRADSTAVPTEASAAGRKPAALAVGGWVVERGLFVVSVRATGRVEALRRAELSLPVSSRIRSVTVTEGDRVEPGDVLVALDARRFEIARNEARARVSNAESEYQINLLSEEDRSPERLEMWAHRSGLTEANEQLARAELDLQDTRLTAPFGGYVAEVQAEVGERARANEPFVTLVDIDVVRVRAEVLESEFGQLLLGATARVSFPAYPDRYFEGTVTALGPEIDAGRGTGIAYLEIGNGEGLLRPGMYAEVELAGRVYEERVSVPRDAVLERDRKLLVFRAADGRAEWQYVETGLSTEKLVEITSGLAPGDTVLVDGHLTLAHGAPVKVSLRGD